jgi:hypothetical protein
MGFAFVGVTWSGHSVLAIWSESWSRGRFHGKFVCLLFSQGCSGDRIAALKVSLLACGAER